MRQNRFRSDVLVIRTQSAGPPSGPTDGNDMSLFGSISSGPKNYPARYFIELTVAGAGSCKYTLYGQGSSGAWGIPVDPEGNQGIVVGGVALSAGVYFTIFEDVGLFPRICLVQHDNSGGTPVTTGIITSLVERIDLR